MITGTFIDEISHDIPSQNWDADDWAREFDTMADSGIDTVILIRAGYRNRATFNSEVLRTHRSMIPAYADLVARFLKLAARHDMEMYIGTYDAGTFWEAGDYAEEVRINKPFCEELVSRYGEEEAFAGWYISHEINAYEDEQLALYEDLSAHLRALKDLPILMSPYMKGIKQYGKEALSFDEHLDTWSHVFKRLEGMVDIVAFQDGNVPLHELPQYLRANRQLAAEHGMTSWSNVESFDRDVRIKFPPIEASKLRFKIEQARRAGMEKLITFEFAHFMSPHSMYPAARALYRQYCSWFS